MDEHPEHNPGEPEFDDHADSAPHNPGEPQFGEAESTEPEEKDAGDDSAA